MKDTFREELFLFVLVVCLILQGNIDKRGAAEIYNHLVELQTRKWFLAAQFLEYERRTGEIFQTDDGRTAKSLEVRANAWHPFLVSCAPHAKLIFSGWERTCADMREINFEWLQAPQN